MIRLIRSFQNNNTFFKESKLEYSKDEQVYNSAIIVNPEVTYQTHMGFGGAFTEASAITLSQANEKQKQEIMDAYYGEKGNKYCLGRTVIHSCDFSEKTRYYLSNDSLDISKFDMSEDDKYIIPMIKMAKKRKPSIWLMSSIWTPLPIMKTNKDPYYGGKLIPKFDELYTEYFIKYFKGMKDRGINISATSIQNEPEAVQVWESCFYDYKDEMRLAKQLSKKIKENQLDVKLIIWDHNRDRVFERSHGILKEIPEQIWGVGYHWYGPEDSKNLTMVHDLYPNHHILFTEGCVEYTNTAENSSGNNSDLWKNAEWYARNIIKDSNNYSEGFIDWNLLLNEKGGPNHVGNFCESPIMYDRLEKQIIYNPSYYFIGHFSRYIQSGAKRIDIKITEQNGVYTTAYKNPNNEIVIIILNQGHIKNESIHVRNNVINLSLPPRSISTLIISE